MTKIDLDLDDLRQWSKSIGRSRVSVSIDPTPTVEYLEHLTQQHNQLVTTVQNFIESIIFVNTRDEAD